MLVLVLGFAIAAGAAALGALVLQLSRDAAAFAALLATSVAGIYAVLFVDPD